jgi:hypothetical protein
MKKMLVLVSLVAIGCTASIQNAPGAPPATEGRFAVVMARAPGGADVDLDVPPPSQTGLLQTYRLACAAGGRAHLTLWRTRGEAVAFYDGGWRARARERLGGDAELLVLDAPVLIDKGAPLASESVLAVVQIPLPWYAPRFFVVNEIRKAVPRYQTTAGLERKYFTLSDDRRFGGVYVWDRRASADAYYDEAWYANVRKTRGADADVTMCDVVVPLAAHSQNRSRGSDALHGSLAPPGVVALAPP